VLKQKKALVSKGRAAKVALALVEPRWLLLFHQIPPNPAYVRVKVGRRLARVGAIALKNSVYALPRSEGAIEDLQWVLREVVGSGGEATLCEARFVDGLSDDEVVRRFQDARNDDYRMLSDEIRSIAQGSARDEGGGRSDKLKAELARLERRLDEIGSIDFFRRSWSRGLQPGCCELSASGSLTSDR